MTTPLHKRPVAIVTACMTREGTRTFVLTTLEVTQKQQADGIHYYLAEADLLEAGYEEPFVHFDDGEAPPFLHAAVRQFLNLSPANANPILLEKS